MFLESEMLNLITRSNEPIVIILFNLDYNAVPHDIINSYPSLQFDKINQPKQGVMILEFNKKEEASEFVKIGTKVNLLVYIELTKNYSILIKGHSL